jgi:beta-lactamase class A
VVTTWAAPRRPSKLSECQLRAFAKGGSIDTPGFHAVCAPAGMLFDDRWVYFSLIINWPSPMETDPKTVAAFLAAGSKALTLVKEALSR